MQPKSVGLYFIATDVLVCQNHRQNLPLEPLSYYLKNNGGALAHSARSGMTR